MVGRDVIVQTHGSRYCRFWTFRFGISLKFLKGRFTHPYLQRMFSVLRRGFHTLTKNVQPDTERFQHPYKKKSFILRN